MNYTEIRNLYERVCSETTSGQIRSALNDLLKLIKEGASADEFLEWESISENYRSLLKYANEGYQDPQQTAILNRLSYSILEIADEVYNTLVLRFLPNQKSERTRLTGLFGSDPFIISARIEEFLVSKQVSMLLEESELNTDERPQNPEMEDIFKLIWLTDRFRDFHVDLSHKIIQSPDVSWPDKCLVVSALTLSILHDFDEEKILLLSEFAEYGEQQVYQRALTGLVLCLVFFNDRLRFYPELGAKLSQIAVNSDLVEKIELILQQLMTARETEKITREFEREVLPDMQKMMPRIEDKLQLGDLTEDDDVEGKNPGWKGMIDEVPGLFEKIEKFSKMQMEGGDVFMGTFSMLKRFDFFNKMSNWFVPFYKENKSVRQTFPDEERYQDRLAEGLEKAFYICNSDKYSFALNFLAVPAAQKSMIVTYFEAELGQMSEMISEEQLLDQSILDNAVFIQYIQDLYRFFKLYPFKSEFRDVFQEKIDFTHLYFYNRYFERSSFLERIATFLFEKEHWSDAGRLYAYLSSRATPRSDYFEKAGYCAQMAGDYTLAITLYRKAELFDSNPLWIATKLGWCYYKSGKYAEAVTSFTRALELKPDDTALQSRLAQCHLAMHDYDSALKIYQQLQFFSPENLKILRPLAFCYFALLRCDEAEEIYSEILNLTEDLTLYDLMNAGHVKLCKGKRKEAIDLYLKSLAKIEPPHRIFFEAFSQDTPLLINNGFPEGEVALVVDYLRFELEKR